MTNVYFWLSKNCHKVCRMASCSRALQQDRWPPWQGLEPFVLRLKDTFISDYATPAALSVCVSVLEIRFERICRCLTNTTVPLCVPECFRVHFQPPVRCWRYLAFCLALIKEQRTALRLIFYMLHDTFGRVPFSSVLLAK